MNYKYLNTFYRKGKKKNGIVWILWILLFASCTPTIHYLGESYDKTSTVDVYYDEKDVEKEYQTIGKMTHDKIFNYDVENIKKSMIEKAKEKGGDGIIFTETEVTRGFEWEGDRLSISAKIIKYKN